MESKFYIVRADSFWYKFDDEQKAQAHYDYIMSNINGKYKQIDKVYLALYENLKTPKILHFWTRNKQ